MKNKLFILLAVILVVGCKQKEHHTYTNDILLPMTPVKNQGEREICWAYGILATIETEHLLRGDSVNLSPTYIGRMLKKYQSPTSLATPHSQRENVQRSTFNVQRERGMGQTALNMLQRYGVVGYDVMPDDATDDLPTPKNVYLLGAKYTPLEFAHSVCAPNEYIGLTSFADSPYYKKIDVPIPDNWEHNKLLNVPLDTLRKRINRALKNHHPICWESRGHVMAIVGKAHDENNRPYYIMKNSWGTRQPHGGLVYMPMKKAWRDVVAVYLTHEAYEGK